MLLAASRQMQTVRILDGFLEAIVLFLGVPRIRFSRIKMDSRPFQAVRTKDKKTYLGKVQDPAKRRELGFIKTLRYKEKGWKWICNMDDDKSSCGKTIELWVLEMWFHHWLPMVLWIIYLTVGPGSLWQNTSPSSGTQKVVSLQSDVQVFIQQFWKKEKNELSLR